jgi:hypothetical protein
VSGHIKYVRIRRADGWGWWITAHTFGGDVVTRWRPTQSAAYALQSRMWNRDDRRWARRADRMNRSGK